MEQKVYKLRQWTESDAYTLALHLNNKKIWDNCRDGLPFPYTIDDALAFTKYAAGQTEQCDYCIEVDNEAAGNIGFVRGTDVERFNAEVGYWLSETHWNKGITTAALQEAIKLYFQQTDVIRLFASVYEYNVSSMHVLEKTGFNKVGILHNACFKNARFINAHYYELLKENVQTFN
ncbi:GNAT family N-acetyltransferase [uncultured Bacteroides sp.]|uniref:GNAT family N-acetyltransferase n=1 Tax=uncultured Bacteroides sp. TaxID=162156 RepID=UPI0025FF3505|nr:GNAT family N-acetyltransferase [uncultured Bacteroides sp.]